MRIYGLMSSVVQACTPVKYWEINTDPCMYVVSVHVLFPNPLFGTCVDFQGIETGIAERGILPARHIKAPAISAGLCDIILGLKVENSKITRPKGMKDNINKLS